MAALFVRSSGYPGMNVLTGVKAIMENITALMQTSIVTAATKKPVLVVRTVSNCLCVLSSITAILKLRTL